MSYLPPRDLSFLRNFPMLDGWDIDSTCYRAHRRDRSVLYFSADGSGRFDPLPEDRHAYGTCYVSTTPAGAFLEKLGRLGPYLNEAIVEETAITEVNVTAGLMIADLTSPYAISHFIDNDLSSGREYLLSQAWGGAFRAAGFDGIYYRARHDPSGESHSLAIFGRPGPAPDFRAAGLEVLKEVVMDDVLGVMQHHYGILAVPPTPLL